VADPATPGRAPRPPRPAGVLRLGRFAGTELYVSASWFVVAALIAVLFAPRVEAVQPGLGPGRYVVGLGVAVMLYLAVLLHAGSHAVVARWCGHPVRSITLSFIGGRTEVDGEARAPRQEFWIAVVGPITSLVVGGAALAVWLVLPDGLLLLTVEALAFSNLLLGVLNLLPALPLDGGRVLKSGIWAATGSSLRGTLVAGWAGRVVAGLVLLYPVLYEPLLGLPPQLVDYLLALVLAVFLWGAASAEMQGARIRARLDALSVRDLARRALAVAPDLPLSEAVRRAQDAEAGGIITLDASGRPSGVVNEAALLAVPDSRRPWVPTSSVTATLAAGTTLPWDIDGRGLLARIGGRTATEYLLVRGDGGVYGVLSARDVEAALRRG